MRCLSCGADGDLDVFIGLVLFKEVQHILDISKDERLNEYTALRVFGLCAAMDAYSFAIGDVADLGHHLLESWRPRFFEFVRSGGDEEIRVFKCSACERLIPEVDREGYRPPDRFALRGCSCQIDCHGISFYSDSRCR